MTSQYYQSTFVLIKPDAIYERKIGEIIGRFERAGLTIETLKLFRWPSEEKVDQHLPNDTTWLTSVGEKTIQYCQKRGESVQDLYSTENPLEIGRKIRYWNKVFLEGGSLVAIVLTGEDAVEKVRKMVGATFPCDAAPGTIRGDFASSSPIAAARRGGACHNLIHASASKEEAEREIRVWFSEEELNPPEWYTPIPYFEKT